MQYTIVHYISIYYFRRPSFIVIVKVNMIILYFHILSLYNDYNIKYECIFIFIGINLFKTDT